MKKLYLDWLLRRGYRFYRSTIIGHSWSGEEPYEYSVDIILKKSIRLRTVSFENHMFSTRENATEYCRELIDYINKRVAA